MDLGKHNPAHNRERPHFLHFYPSSHFDPPKHILCRLIFSFYFIYHLCFFYFFDVYLLSPLTLCLVLEISGWLLPLSRNWRVKKNCNRPISTLMKLWIMFCAGSEWLFPGSQQVCSQTLKMMDMSSSGKENGDTIILEKRNKKYKVQSMKRYDNVWLWAGGWW